jgi:NADH-quinone oxidoreductase chain G
MVKIYINNKVLFVRKNTSVLEACEEIGILIPRFCYHERLNVAGNCRMCLVEVEKTPKPVTSCAFPVVPEMRIYTDTPMVKKARENILEFLLINHPLDCPICDQGGECDLQEQSLNFGSDRSRFFFKKRGVQDKKLGPLVKTIMTRCIHCTRCVRFFQDIIGDVNFGTTLRGQDTEIGAYVNSTLNSELSGNVIDLCPVGALTSKPYAFVARPWEINSTETIDISDSIGSNIRVDTKETEVIRIVPLLNDSLNEEWISDKTRFSFDGLKLQRIGHPFFKENKKFLKLFSWQKPLKQLQVVCKTVKPSEMLIVYGNNVDVESSQVLKKIAQNNNIDLISEQFLETNTNLVSNLRFNTTFSDILSSDLCITFGTNIRFEASLLNVRLKKRSKIGNFIKASVGLTENLNYSNVALGNSISTLIQISEGRHPFCKALAKAKTPMIIIGSGVKKRLDSDSISKLVDSLSNHINLKHEEWFGLNFLPLTSGFVGSAYVGLESNRKLNLGFKKFVYCIGLDSYKNIFNKISKNAFVIAQTPFSDNLLKRVDLILPSTSFLEKEATFINLEGRVQKTAISLKAPNLARDDVKILQTIFTSNLKKSNKFVFSHFDNNKFCFTKNLKVNLVSKKFFKSSFKSSFSNFFITNAITKNSVVMAKCFLTFKQNYKNFIL